MNCKNCNSTRVEEGISMGLTAESGYIGPQASKGIFTYTSPMFCDICLDCGEILRFYIRDNTDRKWIKKADYFDMK